MPGLMPKVPQQSNHFDCGIFLLQYFESFFRTPIVNYAKPVKLKDWFDEKCVAFKREHIHKVIKELVKDECPANLSLIPEIRLSTRKRNTIAGKNDDGIADDGSHSDGEQPQLPNCDEKNSTTPIPAVTEELIRNCTITSQVVSTHPISVTYTTELKGATTNPNIFNRPQPFYHPTLDHDYNLPVQSQDR